MCFVWIWEQTAIISLNNINWLVFIIETECVYCAVRTGSLYTASLTFSNSTSCPHSVFMRFVWISEQTAIISLNNINWLVFITEMECVYCAVRAEYLSLIHVNINLWRLKTNCFILGKSCFHISARKTNTLIFFICLISPIHYFKFGHDHFRTLAKSVTSLGLPVECHTVNFWQPIVMSREWTNKRIHKIRSDSGGVTVTDCCCCEQFPSCSSEIWTARALLCCSLLGHFVITLW